MKNWLLHCHMIGILFIFTPLDQSKVHSCFLLKLFQLAAKRVVKLMDITDESACHENLHVQAGTKRCLVGTGS